MEMETDEQADGDGTVDSIFYDLIGALQGFPGSIFVEDNGTIKPAPGIPFAHPGQLKLLTEYCQLADQYRTLRGFADYFRNPPFLHKQANALAAPLLQSLKPDASVNYPNELCGLYIYAFCQGLRQVLDEYVDRVIDLEEQVAEDPCFPLQGFKAALTKYMFVFPVLESLIKEIQSRRVHGCVLLEILHEYAATGSELVKSFIKTIAHFCYRAFYRQLTPWLIHGVLKDDYDEFFVERCVTVTTVDLDTSILSSSEQGSDDDNDDAKEIVYRLRPTMLPASCVRSQVATAIIFVGSTVEMFQRRHTVNSGDGASSFSKLVHRTDSILKEKEVIFTKNLTDLHNSPEFNLDDFESTVNEIRKCVAEQLCKLLRDSNLLGRLQLMKDIYLMGRGELFQVFIEHSRSAVSGPVSSHMEKELNRVFRDAAAGVRFDDASAVDDFTVQLDWKKQTKTVFGSVSSLLKEPSGDAKPPDSPWACFSIGCNVKWPMHILFTPVVLERYNRILNFLLAVKRVQLDLDQCWLQQTKAAPKDDTADKSADDEFAKLRSHMSFLVNNLQYYLQVDVLESRYKQLVHAVDSAEDFEVIEHAHATFLNSVTVNSLITLKPAAKCINDIPTDCANYSRVVAQPIDTSAKVARVRAVGESFRKNASFLVKLLATVKEQRMSPDVPQFLLRLDYNKYASEKWNMFLSRK